MEALRAYTVLLFFSAVIATVFGLSCYQCDSGDDFRCSEEITGNDLRPLPCVGLSDPQYCVKVTGVFGGNLGTRRMCSEKFLDNYCTYVGRPGDGREYRSCVYTCTGDGCNSATSVPRGPIIFLMPIVGLFVSLRKML